MTLFPPADAFVDLIKLSLREDLGENGDVTSMLTVPADLVGVGTLYQKAAGVVCGLPIVAEVCRALDPMLAVEGIDDRPIEAMEGRWHAGGLTPIGRIRGSMRSLLAVERTMLNFLQRLSGVASLTAKYVAAIEGTRAKILDTRKTLPGYRLLDKYAVAVGGGMNHRVGLYDMVLVKDNHLAQLAVANPRGDKWSALAGMVERSKHDRSRLKIEVEVIDEAGFDRVLAMPSVDYILLDNMDVRTMTRCVRTRDAALSPTLLEASGGVNLETLAGIARTGVDRISVGALTHSASALDISFEIEPE